MKSFEIGATKTKVFYLHGLRGHGLSQRAALQHMVKNLQINLISLELPGHGKDSITQHCFVPAYEQLVEDVVAEVMRLSLDAEQVLLMGYSFGACLMIMVAQKLSADSSFKPNVAGLIGISTAFNVGHNVARWQLKLSSLIAPLSRFLFERTYKLSTIFTIREMNVNLISGETAVQKAILEDDLTYKGRIPLSTSAEVYKVGFVAKKTLKESTLPALLLHSEDDQIALAPKQDDFGDNVALKIYQKMRHNCIDGVNREAVHARKLMLKFIVERL